MKNLLLFLPVFFLLGCHVGFNTIQGNGIMEVKERSFDTFERLEVSGAFDVKIVPSQTHRVIVETDENLQDYIRIEQDGNRIKIRTKDNSNLRSKKPIRITAYMTQVNRIELAGSGNIVSDGLLEHPDKIDLTIAGSGDANLEVKSPDVKVSIAGSGKVILNGKTKDLEVSIGGSGDYRGENLMSEQAEINIAGSGSARVFASVALDVSVAGSGDVYYKGDPKIKKSIAGAGSVKPL